MLVLALLLCAAAGARAADGRCHVFHNASFWTGEPTAPFAPTALLVQHSIIRAVGSLAAVHEALLGQVLARVEEHAAGDQPGRAPLEDARVAAASPGAEEGVAGAGCSASEVVYHDLQGRFVMPGFVDAHTHVIPGGLALGRVMLRGVASRAEFVQRVAGAAAALGPREWVLGGLWDEGDWGGELPSRHWLDEAGGGRPVYLTRHDSHLGVASSEALRRARISAASPDPSGGVIDRDDRGEPTGIVREKAMQLLASAIPEPSAAARAAALAAASRLALSRGITTMVDLGRYPFSDADSPWRDLMEVYLPAAEAGELQVRIFAYTPLVSRRRLEAFTSARGRSHPGGRLHWGGTKEFVDGSLGSHTALLWQPYADVPLPPPAVPGISKAASPAAEPGVGAEEAAAGAAAGARSAADAERRWVAAYGQRMVGDTDLRAELRGVVAAGLQSAVHAIGDRAIDELVAAYDAALREVAAEQLQAEGRGGSGAEAEAALEERRAQLAARRPLTVEHVQHISGPNATAALAAVGLRPVINPLHLLTDRELLLPRLGPDRAAASRSFAFGSLAAAGLRPACGSDWPVADLQPLTSMYAAVHRTAPPEHVAAELNARLGPSARMEVEGVGQHAAAVRAAVDADHAGAVGSPEAAELQAEDEEEAGERLTMQEALLGHTAWAAEAAGLGWLVGRLAPGLRADLVEIDTALMWPSAAAGGGRQAGRTEGAEGGLSGGEWPEWSPEAGLARRIPAVLRTWVDGQVVYEAGRGAVEVGALAAGAEAAAGLVGGVAWAIV
ncbi:hypothetical protein HYH03_009296 [Edaphochlamys debaryana]|uniref:Amidohydrolase 3 domain-containing protein n=1 Tax=Edaphochlamys debaryana TaxID=47281 RepID=A0A835XY40_9CHLO|nr:hypothetical protein HYH03_009296 [Edaphochlamys debaryana]|eukprot:KAG2492348.1 hypothetical protein HYH03_009296 [Edaphochlamys debaryana]